MKNRIEINPIRAKRIKKLIRDLDMTQKQFAEKINLTQQTISKIINGKTPLTEQTATKICEMFPECSVNYLMGFDVDDDTTQTAPRIGRWSAKPLYKEFFICSRCQKPVTWASNYCPNCGAKMEVFRYGNDQG